MNILVTGASGYIGGQFIKLLHTKYNITALVRVQSNTESLNQYSCNILKFNDYSQIESLLLDRNIDGIVHFAANVIVDHSAEDITNLVNSNIEFGAYLLNACRNLNIKWFLNTGTFWQNYNQDIYNPVNFYAATKEAFEKIARYYTETSDLIFTTIKLNDTFGEFDNRKKFFYLWKKIAKSGEELNMTKGEQIVDICYVDDVIFAYDKLIKLLNSDGKKSLNNKTYVVSSKEKMTLKELSKVFEEATNTKLNIKWGSKPYREREVMVPWKNGELVPGWKQKYTLKDAIIKAIGERVV